MPEDSRLPSSHDSHFEIREARADDVGALARLEDARFETDKLSRRSLSALARSPSASFRVARVDGRIAGYAVILLRRGARSARLYSIAVSADEAGRGLGRQLLAAAEEAAAARGAERLRLEVRADNARAIRFYAAAGYRPAGERDGYYEDGMTALLFVRGLAEAAPGRRLGQAA